MHARAIVTAISLCLAAQAFAQGAPQQQVDLGALGLGEELDRARVGTRLYVALAGGGVAIVDVSDPARPRLVSRFADGRRVERLFVSGDTLLLVETRHELVPWSLKFPDAPQPTALAPRMLEEARQPPQVAAGPETPAPGPTPAPAAGPGVPGRGAVTGKVVDVRDGRAIFDVGREAGFVPGTRVRIISQRLEEKPDLTTGKTVLVPSGAVSAVVAIEHADAQRSMALLGRGDAAEPGDLVQVTNELLTESLFQPTRAPFTALVGFHARPFLGLGGNRRAFGALVDAYGSLYLSSFPLAVSVSASPVGFSLGAVESHYPSAFALTVAYSTDYFEIGLGGGALIGREGPCTQVPLSDPSCEVNTGATVNQVLRLGALDGLNLVWRSSIFSRPNQFVFGVGRGEINLPLTRQLGLFGAGGGGENGWAFGEFGVRTYLGGVGAKGTTILSASLGYGSVFDGRANESVGGPSVAFGMEWRL